MLLRLAVVTAAQFQLAQGGMEERILRKPIVLWDRTNLFQPALRPLRLRDRNRPVECHDRSGLDRSQRVIQRSDPGPVGGVRSRSGRMERSDSGLEMVRAQARAYRRALQKLQPFTDELTIPQGPVLISERLQLSKAVHAPRQSGGVEAHQCGERIGLRCCSEPVIEEDGSEPHRLAAELRAHRGLF